MLEAMARDMLAEDPDLRREFEQKKETDPEFAGSPQTILDWFYERSPYWDECKNVYPIGKIFDRSVVRRLR